jgi:DNA mismatch repair ATPase MutL
MKVSEFCVLSLQAANCLPVFWCARFQYLLCTGLKEQLQKCSYVGMVDMSQLLAQRDTDLILVNVEKLAQDLFYQRVCFRLAQRGACQVTVLCLMAGSAVQQRNSASNSPASRYACRC